MKLALERRYRNKNDLLHDDWKEFHLNITWERTGALLAGAAVEVVLGLWGVTEGLRTVCGAGWTRAPAVMTVVVGFWAEVIVTTAVFCYGNKKKHVELRILPLQCHDRRNILPELPIWMESGAITRQGIMN